MAVALVLGGFFLTRSDKKAGGRKVSADVFTVPTTEPGLTPPQAIGEFTRQAGAPSPSNGPDYFQAEYARAAPRATLQFSVRREPPHGSASDRAESARRTEAAGRRLQTTIALFKGALFGSGASVETTTTSGATQYTCISGQAVNAPQIRIVACGWQAGFLVNTVALIPASSVDETISLGARAQATNPA